MSHRQGHVAAAVIRLGAIITVCACAPAPDVGAPVPAGPLPEGHFSAIVEQVIVPRCATAACHAGDPAPFFPQLDADVAWERLLGPSEQAGLNMVEPFDPENSYLVLKLRSNASSVGGVGTPMPINDALLTEEEIQVIEAWIRDGAQND
jgi:uncharacterized membrane protein